MCKVGRRKIKTIPDYVYKVVRINNEGKYRSCYVEHHIINETGENRKKQLKIDLRKLVYNKEVHQMNLITAFTSLKSAKAYIKYEFYLTKEFHILKMKVDKTKKVYTGIYEYFTNIVLIENWLSIEEVK